MDSLGLGIPGTLGHTLGLGTLHFSEESTGRGEVEIRVEFKF